MRFDERPIFLFWVHFLIKFVGGTKNTNTHFSSRGHPISTRLRHIDIYSQGKCQI